METEFLQLVKMSINEASNWKIMFFFIAATDFH